MFVNLAKGFAEAGHRVDLVLVRRRGPYLNQVPPGVRIVDLECRHVALSLYALVRYLRRHRPSVLFSALHSANAVALAASHLACTNVRVVPTVHSLLGYDLQRAAQKGLKAGLSIALARRAYRWANQVIAVSGDVADHLTSCTSVSRRQITVIGNPVSVPRRPQFGPQALPPFWKARPSGARVLAAGRLTGQKDFPTLLRAFGRLRERRPASLVILGEGEDRPGLEALSQRLGIASDVHMPGFVDDPYTYMRSASVFVLSSRDEPFGNVLVEAMACGTPVVSTSCPGAPREILREGALGSLVPVGEAEALAQAISATLDDPLSAARLKARAGDFSSEHAVKAYLNFTPR